MGERFSGLLIASWMVALIAALAFYYGLMMVMPNPPPGGYGLLDSLAANGRQTIGLTLMIFGLFAILASGAVRVLIAIYQKVDRTGASHAGKPRTKDGTPEAAPPM